VKVRRPGGELAYAVPEYEPDRIAPHDHLRRVLGEWVAEVVHSGNLVIVRTPPGCAHVVASALDRSGLADEAVAASGSGRPFLGICVGMQLLYEGSEESPGVPGLGVLPGTLRLLPDTVKRPQMQWNVLDVRRPSGLFAPVDDPVWVYFVHSYAAAADDDIVVATCDYGGPLAAAVERGPLWATQFHPEKSGGTGLEILSGFVAAAATSAGVAIAGEERR